MNDVCIHYEVRFTCYEAVDVMAVGPGFPNRNKHITRKFDTLNEALVFEKQVKGLVAQKDHLPEGSMEFADEYVFMGYVSGCEGTFVVVTCPLRCDGDELCIT